MLTFNFIQICCKFNLFYRHKINNIYCFRIISYERTHNQLQQMFYMALYFALSELVA
jgi:hypothetical protein